MLKAGLFLLVLGLAPAAWAANPEAEAAHQRGLGLARANQLAEAIAALEQATALDPASAEILGDLGNTKLVAGDLKGAITALEQAVKLKPDLGVARYNLAYALRKSGQFAKAADQYRIFLAATPNDPDAHYGLAESLRATGDKLAAAEAYENYANAERRPAQARWVEKARATAAELRAGAAAPTKASAPLAKSGPEKPGAAVQAAPKRLSFSRSGKANAEPVEAAAAPVEAAEPPVAAAAPARAARPTAFSQALTQLQAGQFGEAEPALRAFANAHPDDSIGTAAFASARLGLLDGVGAEQAYQRALENASPEAKASLYFGLAESQRLQDKREEALRSYRLVLDDATTPAPVRRNAEERLAALTAG